MYAPLHKKTQALYNISIKHLMSGSEKKFFLTQSEYDKNISFFSNLNRLTDNLDADLKELNKIKPELNKVKAELTLLKQQQK